MSRPAKKKTIKSIIPDKKKCDDCKKELIISNFYNTNNVLSDGKSSICKKCTKKRINYNNIQSIYDVLKGLDIPFFYSYWATCKEKNPEDPWTIYIRIANSKMNEFKTSGWKDSIFEPQLNNENINSSNKVVQFSKKSDFILTDEIIDKWGDGYSHEEYYYFEKKWFKLIDNYGEKTSLHVEGLITYIRFRVREELATARGDIKEAKDWGAMASTAAKDARLNVSQLSKSDISGGVDLLPQLFEAVESEVGIIPTLPHLKEQPYDDADLIIWCVVNYLRRLEDKPRIQYKEIWSFYDEMLAEHFKQKGYSDEMIIVEKKKRNNVFRDLGQVYREPVYEEGDN